MIQPRDTFETINNLTVQGCGDGLVIYSDLYLKMGEYM